jgi:hypothetical protein
LQPKGNTLPTDHTLVLSTVTATIHAPIDRGHCEYSNLVRAAATDEFLAFLEKNGITFEQARAVNQALTDSHNREETPNFAKSIERRALAR